MTPWPIDWQQVALELRAHYGTAYLSRRLNRSHETICRMARGETVEPRFGLGLELLLMYRKATRKEPPMFGGAA